MISPGELIQLVSPQGKKYLRQLQEGEELHTHDGKIDLSLIKDLNFGDIIETHLGRPYRIVRPTLYDLLKTIERRTQIIYPKDIGYIVMRLGIGPGCQVVEAGCGSGALTMAFAYLVGNEGHVYSFDRREDFLGLCEKNLKKVGLLERVSLEKRDIEDGFDIEEADAGFLDVRTPWEYLSPFAHAVKNGSCVGFLLPTVNQVCNLLENMEKGPFVDIEVIEIFLRRYKTNHQRLRPEDRMVAHTGFLIFARVSR